ncbi:MAG: sigma-70 family RNA polymerase sigma factor [Myxococcales bacterium]|nr:sigma-70 family RNA polymerase sigma factor [Myxococcales bacterium]
MPEAATPSDSAGPPTFAAVYEAHASLVWRSLKRLGVREADVPDVAQEVFVVIHRRLATATAGALKSWVYGICLKVAADYRKRAHVRRESLVDESPERANSGETAVREVAQRQARTLLDRMLDQLDEDKRTVFVLFELEQASMHEVAAAAGVPLQTAYARLYAARKQMETLIAQHRKEVLA